MNTDTEQRLARMLSDYRRHLGAIAPPEAIWDLISARATHRPTSAKRAVAALAATTIALTLAVIALELPAAKERATTQSLIASLGTLIYERHGTTPHAGTGPVDSNAFISRDLRTGRERVLATGAGCGMATQVDASRRHIAFCGSDGTQILDVTTGTVTHLAGSSPWTGDQIGWTESGTLLLSHDSYDPREPSLLAYDRGRVSVVYGGSVPIFQVSVVPLTNGVIASTRCRTTCKPGDALSLIVEQPGSQHVLFRRNDAYPVVAFDGGRALLYGIGIYGGSTPRLGILHLDGEHPVSTETAIDAGPFGQPWGGEAASGPTGVVAISTGRTRPMVSVFDPRSLQTREVTPGTGRLVWTPDGRGILYRYGNAIRITDLTGHNHLLVRGKNITPIAVTRTPPIPTSDELIYLSLHYVPLDAARNVVNSVRVMSLDMRTGRKRQIASGGPCGDFGTPIDVASMRVALCEYAPSVGNPSVLDLRTHTKSRVPEGYGFPVAWNADHNLLLLTDSPDSKVFELVGGSPKLIYDPRPTKWIFDVIPLADGDLVVMQNASDSCGQGCPAEVIRHQQHLAAVAGLPVVAFDDGRSLVYQTTPLASGDDGTLEILRAERGRYIRRSTGAHGTFGAVQGQGAVVGPDGRIAVLGWHQGHPSGVYLFDPVSATLRRIVDGNGPLAWTPDGRGIVYSGPDLHSILITDLEGRSRVLVRGEDVRALAVLND